MGAIPSAIAFAWATSFAGPRNRPPSGSKKGVIHANHRNHVFTSVPFVSYSFTSPPNAVRAPVPEGNVSSHAVRVYGTLRGLQWASQNFHMGIGGTFGNSIGACITHFLGRSLIDVVQG